MVTDTIETDSKKRKFIVIDEDENIEFVIKVKISKKGNRVYKLFYSKSDIWLSGVRGMLRLTMVDTGNDVKLKFADVKNIKKLDYGDLNSLHILIKLQESLDGELPSNIKELIKL